MDRYDSILAFYLQQGVGVGLLAGATSGNLHVVHATTKSSTHIQCKYMYTSHEACCNDEQVNAACSHYHNMEAASGITMLEQAVFFPKASKQIE